MDSTGDVNISERQRNILKIIIEEHVNTARPVASEQIVSRYELNVSSATVRNDMVDLERAGLIVQPHTSAGRVPSELGYRYFVSNLMNPTTLSADEQRRIRHQFHQIELDVDEWVRLATAVLSRSIHSAAVATPPRSTEVRLKHFELLSLSETRLLVVLVGDDGSVTQQMVTAEEECEQSLLSDLAGRLNRGLAGKTAPEIIAWGAERANVAELPGVAPRIITAVAGMLAKLQQPETSQLYHEGLVHMLEQPEFRNPEKMQQVLELFERSTIWSNLIPSVLNQQGVQVIIGDEQWGEGMGACSVVLARYGLENKLTGILGVIGPTRMPYSRSVSTVGYISHVLSDLLTRMYNPRGDAGSGE